MKKKVKIVIVVLIVAVFAGLYSIVDINSPVYDAEIDNSEYIADTLDKGDVLEQTFSLDEKWIDGIEVKLAAEGGTDNTIAGYQLTDLEGQILAEGETSLADLKNGKFFEFRFDRIQDTKGNSYTFRMELKDPGDAVISAYEVPSETADTGFELNGEQNSQTLALRVITHRFNVETLVVTLFFAVYVILFMRWLAKLFKG